MIRRNFKNQLSKFDLTDLKSIASKLNETENITHTDLKRIQKGKLTAQFWASFTPCSSLAKDATRYLKSNQHKINVSMRIKS